MNNITITYEKTDILQLAELSYQKYCCEIKCHNGNLPMLAFDVFLEAFLKEAEKNETVTAYGNGKVVGFLMYEIAGDDSKIYCNIPLFGYAASDLKVLDRLFQHLAEKIVVKCTEISVHIYSHDIEIQRLFSFLQFYMMSEKCIRRCKDDVSECGVIIRKLDKTDLIVRWKEIWSLVAKIIDHLRKSPIFYPGEEFTEEVYKEFLLDDNVNVYVAEDEGKFIGMIEANSEKPAFPFASACAINVGEAYIEEPYRGKGVAEALLHYAEKDQNSEFLWVEHGTANPNARGFWNKYFKTYEYLLIRNI